MVLNPYGAGLGRMLISAGFFVAVLRYAAAVPTGMALQPTERGRATTKQQLRDVRGCDRWRRMRRGQFAESEPSAEMDRGSVRQVLDLRRRHRSGRNCRPQTAHHLLHRIHDILHTSHHPVTSKQKSQKSQKFSFTIRMRDVTQK